MFTEIAVSSDLGERTCTPAIVESTLPLPELMPREPPRPEDEKIKGGGVATIDGRTILWRVANRSLTLELANLNGSFVGSQVLSFTAPGPVLPYCSLVTKVDTEHFAVDFITKQGFLYTLSLPYAAFRQWEPTAEWRTVKSPFGVDTVVPLGLVAKSPLELVVTLADGSVHLLQRASILGEFETTPFRDPNEPGFFNRFWSRTEIPGLPHLSSRAAVDVAVFIDKVVTLSVDGSLRLWSASTLDLLSQTPALEASKYLTTPSNYLKVSGSSLIVYKDSEFSVYNESLQQLHKFAVPAEVRGWYMVDYLWEQENIIAAFKAFELSQIWCLSADSSYLVSAPLPTISRIPDAREMQTFVDSIFSVKNYSSSTLRKALATFSEANESDVVDLTVHAPPASTLSLRDAITEAVKKCVMEQKTNYRLEWIRFDSLCQEFECAQSEILAVGKSCDGLVWSIRNSFYTLLCPVSNVQRALLVGETEASPSPGTSLLGQINSLYAVFAPSAIVQFEQELQASIVEFGSWGSQLLGSRITTLYETLVQPHVDEQALVQIRSQLVSLQDVDAKLLAILSECLIKDSSSDTEQDTLTPLGCSALATVALSHAESSLKFVSKVLLFLLFAYGEGITRNHVQTFAIGLGHLRTSAAIISLQAPLDSESKRYNSRASAIQISVSHLYLKVRDFDSLVARLWHQLDFTEPENLGVILNLVREKWHPVSLISATKYLGDDPESQFIRGLAKMSTPDQQEIGEGMVISYAPWMSKYSTKIAIKGLGQGLPAYFAAVADISYKVGASPRSVMNLYKLAARHGGQAPVFVKLLDLALLNHNNAVAYEAIVGLAKHKDLELRKHLEQFLNMVVRSNPIEFVCKDLVFAGLTDLVSEVMASREELGDKPTYKLHYVWCISRRDYLGAAKVMYKQAHKGGAELPKADLLTVAINALRLLEKDQRWMVVDKKLVTESDIAAEVKRLIA